MNKTVWDFVEKYYPNYSSSDEIAYNNDLQKIIDGEINGCAEDLYNDMLNEGIFEEDIITIAQQRLDKSNAEIYADAIQNYLNNGYYIEEIEPSIFQSVFPKNESENSQLHSKRSDAFKYIVERFNDKHNTLPTIKITF